MCINYVSEMYCETLTEWSKYTPDISPIPIDLLKNIINIILKQTFFQFNNNCFIQNYGITMGAPSSVKIANITLYKHLSNILKDFKGPKPLHCFRLIDDVMGVSLHSEEDLLIWFNYLNSCHTSIKFTIEYSFTEIPFLDTLVYVDNGKIKTKLYRKPSNKKQFLEYNSEHPTHMKNSIPYAQALRYKRIIEDNQILHTELASLKQNFINRGYPTTIIEKQIGKTDVLERRTLIEYKLKTKYAFNFTPLVLTFSNIYNNNGKNNIYKIINFIWEELTRMAPDLHKLPPPKIIFSKCKSIGSCIESSAFPPKWWLKDNITLNPNNNDNTNSDTNRNTRFKCSPCNSKRCLTCLNIMQADSFLSTNYRKSFPLMNNCNCTSANIVYLITCTECSIQYVGETHGALRDRLNGHRSDIKTKKHTPIGIHFNSTNHSINNVQIIPIEILNTDNINFRRSREFYWQLRIGTIFPNGLNNYPVNNTVFINTTLHTTTDFRTLLSLRDLYDGI
jgi:hypothetical protein